MPISQNLRFWADSPADDEFSHPDGAGLMRRLYSRIASAGWLVEEMENWRDCGWSTVCQRGNGKLQIAFASIADREWILQIGPEYIPGCLGGLFGWRPSAAPNDIFELALVVHQALASDGLLANPRWQWDGFPDERSAPEPKPA